MGVFALAGAQLPAWAAEWDKVEGKDIVLFYPGQSAWEWILTQNDHSGAKKLREGKPCLGCHDGEQKDIGDLIVSGKKLEPHPIPGKPGTLTLNVKVAHDVDRMYVRLQWKNGGGGGEKMDPKYQSKITVMLNPDTFKAAELAGCWATCHNDMQTMPDAVEGTKLTKYLTQSRTKVTRTGGDENYKAQSDLDRLLADGQFMEYWQARLSPGEPAVAVDGHILEKREQDKTPSVSVMAMDEGDGWTVVMSRTLASPGPGHFDLVPGKPYFIGFAVHDNYTEHRFHYVSFGYSLELDSGDADFIAVRQ